MDSHTNRTPLIIASIVLLVVIAGSAYAFVQTNTKTAEVVVEPVAESMEKKDDGMMKKEADGMVKDEGAVMEKGSYEAYSKDKLALAETGDVVLFFHASWCPSCRGLNASIESNRMAIPKGVHILKVDYDKETEQKKMYGVTYQHTLVQVRADGTMIKKWSGNPSLDSLLAQIQ